MKEESHPPSANLPADAQSELVTLVLSDRLVSEIEQATAHFLALVSCKSCGTTTVHRKKSEESVSVTHII